LNNYGIIKSEVREGEIKMIKSKKVQEKMAHLKRVREFKKHNDITNISFEMTDVSKNESKIRVIQLNKLYKMYGKNSFFKMLKNCIELNAYNEYSLMIYNSVYYRGDFRYRMLEIFKYI
jgi:hypothetical protein